MVRIQAAVSNPANTAYLMLMDHSPIGAALMHWDADESELLYIVVDKAYRGQGYGKAAMAGLVELAHQQAVKSMVVGTANTSIENILFYQKCGFRMDSVRKDYFSYFSSPVYEHGIQIQDMVVFRRAINLF